MKIGWAVALASLFACNTARPADPPAEAMVLVEDALRAASEIKVSGNTDSVVAAHSLSSRYAPAMRPHYSLMSRLHKVGIESGIRYPRSRVNIVHRRFCGDSTDATLIVRAGVRYDMVSANGDSGVPPYTASEEEHIFRIEHVNGQWVVREHHEISLAEFHDPRKLDALRRSCS